MPSHTAYPVAQTDTATTCSTVSVGLASTPVVGSNGSRAEITIVNDGANIVYLAFSTAQGVAPTAVANSGVRLAGGASWTSGAYNGAIAGIALTGATGVTVAEF